MDIPHFFKRFLRWETSFFTPIFSAGFLGNYRKPRNGCGQSGAATQHRWPLLISDCDQLSPSSLFFYLSSGVVYCC